MALDHIGFNVKDFGRSRAFYFAALAPLGITLLHEGEGWAMAGAQGKGCFWFGSYGAAATPVHVAFAAASRTQVDDFYDAALAAGGKDNGAPGVRAQYHPNYYAAYVFDPDGHNIEAVFHGA